MRCKNCKGSGVAYFDSHDHFKLNCVECNGTGVVPNEIFFTLYKRPELRNATLVAAKIRSMQHPPRFIHVVLNDDETEIMSCEFVTDDNPKENAS